MDGIALMPKSLQTTIHINWTTATNSDAEKFRFQVAAAQKGPIPDVRTKWQPNENLPEPKEWLKQKQSFYFVKFISFTN